MLIDFKNLVTISIVLFAIIDILGSIPIILDIRNKVGHIDEKFATIISGSIMITFLFGGEFILKLIGIDLISFSLAGAIVIFIIGLEMTLNRNFFKEGKTSTPKGTIVMPIAFPMIAGAGTLTTLLSLRSQYNMLEILIGVLINLAIIYFVIKFLPNIERFFGTTGIDILRKVFGFVLLSISMKIFISNLAAIKF
ncbi:MAG TPA: MarC family protein [Chitinophagales bacterium]|nr:MarC family protein [Chitinophagales bacterium]HMU99048.1 MarC family protein [Chitinophagales bacterium]HMW95374.1 MarC family protein [Chitinophagales bacterium]HMZ94578.1 MarC family protein [Chitinophagales bacterium]HNB39606.1 MarC family protein [Chitinophagales bacterium]